jgi:hypothetical protein
MLRRGAGVVRLLAVMLTVMVTVPAVAAAQEARGVEIVPPSGAAPGPLVRALGLLDDPRLEELTRNGFPARMHWRLELWSAGTLVNEFEGAQEWDVLVRFDPLAKEWVVTRGSADEVVRLGRFDKWSEATAVAQSATRAPLPATKVRRHYYIGRVTVRVLSLTDLREAELWLKGEVGPAVRGEGSAGSVFGRFFRAVAARLLGAEQRVYEGRSIVFTPG